eukprot:11892405-Karenia_brevis.AAC.1
MHRYYRKYLATIKLVSCWLPLEEWKQVTRNIQPDLHVLERFRICGCRDYDVGIWFKIESDSSDDTLCTEEQWGEDRCKLWVSDLVRSTEAAPTLAGSVQVVMQAWQKDSKYMHPS